MALMNLKGHAGSIGKFTLLCRRERNRKSDSIHVSCGTEMPLWIKLVAFGWLVTAAGFGFNLTRDFWRFALRKQLLQKLGRQIGRI